MSEVVLTTDEYVKNNFLNKEDVQTSFESLGNRVTAATE